MSDPRDERFSRVANLRRRELDHALGCLHPTRPIPVPVTTRLAVSPLVALAPDLVPHLGFERLFQDQLRGQEHQVRTIRGRPQPTIHQGPKALACPLRRGYSLHRDAPCWAPGAKPEARFLIAQAGCIPTEISSNVTPSPPSCAARYDAPSNVTVLPLLRGVRGSSSVTRSVQLGWMYLPRLVLRTSPAPIIEWSSFLIVPFFLLVRAARSVGLSGSLASSRIVRISERSSLRRTSDAVPWTRQRQVNRSTFGACRLPTVGNSARGLDAGGVVVNGQPEALDAGQSWEPPDSRFRDQGPHRRGSELWNPPHAQCGFDAFGDAEAGRHVRVRRKLDGAAGDRAERETIGAPHFDL